MACKGAVKRVPGGIVCFTADCQVRVFGISGLIDRLSDRMYIRNIPLYGCMDRPPRYIQFISQPGLPIW